MPKGATIVDSASVRLIEPRQPAMGERLRETWVYRRLVWYFSKRFIQKLYARTWLGRLWIPLRPGITLGSQILIYGGLLGAPSDGKPYALFFIIGSSVWEMFYRTAYFSTRSLELNKRLLKRLYIPRLVVLIGSAGAGLAMFFVYISFALGFVVYYYATSGTTHLGLGLNTLAVPVGLLMVLLIALSIGLWLSIYSARARDVRWTLRYALSFWFLITPVIYPLSQVPSGYRTAAELNPMAAPIEMIRYGLLGVGHFPPLALAVSIAAILVVGGGGLWFFNRSEASALDNL